MSSSPEIIYTLTDEAPALATASLLPIVQRFAVQVGCQLTLKDISLAGRILAVFAEYLEEQQRSEDALATLAELTKSAQANIIKLPNISASIPQLKGAISELQAQGFALPDYPDSPKDDQGHAIKARYDSVKGSAVNPVLREGNSDRRAPEAVKQYARVNPHRMGPWSPESRTRVASMEADDFRHNEQSVTLEQATTARIEFVDEAGNVQLLLEQLELLEGEILDASVMRREALVSFLSHQLVLAREEGLLFSLHLKATMMKVSDPIIFGHAVKVFFADLIAEYGQQLEELGVNWNNGCGDLIAKVATLPEAQRTKLEAHIERCFQKGAQLAMVNSAKGITNLHVPSDVIIDASMPAMIRESGKMWNEQGDLQDTLAVIPDSSYAAVYAQSVEYCKKHGAFDPSTMGTVSNVGLMAKKAEEYGSHDKTFELEATGVVRVVAADGTVLTEHKVAAGDIWRACQTKDEAVRDWISLAVSRARQSGQPAVFWLDAERPHDKELIVKINRYLGDLQTTGLELHILAPDAATRFTLERLSAGEDTIAVTGNVLRDYLTDLFPILELGTSAKMLSIVPLMQGGGLFETGAGGSAPKHVQQLVEENYLRWDSLGEFLALAVSFEHCARVHQRQDIALLGQCLDRATTRLLLENKSPSRKLGGLDNRGSHVYLALFWADELARQQEDLALAERFQSFSEQLEAKHQQILAEYLEVQGSPVELGGYYHPEPEKVASVMRPSALFNQLLADWGDEG